MQAFNRNGWDIVSLQELRVMLFKLDDEEVMKLFSLPGVLVVFMLISILCCGGKSALKGEVFVDTKTNLVWAAKDSKSALSWERAKSYCENYRGGGYTGWRMPTQDELARLRLSEIERGGARRSGSIWASETRGLDAANFYFDQGARGWARKSVDNVYHALPVRSGE
ncbi:MAG: DUF1566 domain-containing protein [Syntrophales bacterium]|nr:DUF1566 domain-containing protein [Syntrophales bacterium]